MYRNLIID